MKDAISDSVWSILVERVRKAVSALIYEHMCMYILEQSYSELTILAAEYLLKHAFPTCIFLGTLYSHLPNWVPLLGKDLEVFLRQLHGW